MDQTAQHMILFVGSNDLLHNLTHRELQMTREEFDQRCYDSEEQGFF